MAEITFYIGNPEDYFKDESTRELRDIHSIQILESRSLANGYEVIDTVKFPINSQYITTDQASNAFIDRYYRLRFISDPEVTPVKEYVYSDPVMPEIIAEIVDDVREWLGDTDLEQPAFTDKEYLEKIRFALRQWKGTREIQTIEERDAYPIQLLVMEMQANVIANHHAKYYELNNPSHRLDKSQIMVHYHQVAENIRMQYREYEKRLNMGSGGYDDDMIISQMPSAKVSTVSRFSRTSARYITGNQTSFRKREFYSQLPDGPE